MSEHRNAPAHVAASSARRRRRWMTGVVAVLGASGLALGGLGVPVAANNLNSTENVHVSADVQGDCVTAGAGTGPVEETVNPQQHSELRATGQVTATVSVCRDGLGGTPPGHPGDPVPGSPDDLVPDDPAGELNDVLTGALEDGLPAGDGFPGGDIPGGDDVLPGGDGADPDHLLPADVGGLVTDGRNLVPNLLDRLARINPPAADEGDSDGNDGDHRATKPSPSGAATGPADVGATSADPEPGSGPLTGTLLDADLEGGEPGPIDAVVAPGGSLPRTGGAPGAGLLRLIAFLGVGRALFGLGAGGWGKLARSYRSDRRGGAALEGRSQRVVHFEVIRPGVRARARRPLRRSAVRAPFGRSGRGQRP